MYKPPPAFPLLVVEAPHVTHTRSEEPTASTTHDGDALAVDVELASMLVAALPDASKNAGFPAHVPYMCPPAGAGATSGTTTCVFFYATDHGTHAASAACAGRVGAGLFRGQSNVRVCFKANQAPRGAPRPPLHPPFSPLTVTACLSD